MASFDSINYSLRPNKSIERGLAFESLRQIQTTLDLPNQVYVGFGSIWFTDFHMAHRTLGICDMVSMEGDEIGFARARFNRPLSTIRVQNVHSNDGLPALFTDPLIRDRPWIIWLDYDRALTPEAIEDMRSVIENAPPNSIFLTTFSATPNAYGKPKNRALTLREMLGGVVPDDLSLEQVDNRLPETLADLASDFMVSVANTSARPGRFIPAFRMIYTDTATMVTVGGILPTPGAVPAAGALTRGPLWPGIIKARIVAPHLTMKEAAVLQAVLPRARKLNRKAVQKLGFDLQADQIASFEQFYRYYPLFAQVTL